MKKICSLLFLLYFFTCTSSNAAVGGLLIWNSKGDGWIMGWCLHFKHSSKENWKNFADQFCEDEMLIADMWKQDLYRGYSNLNGCISFHAVTKSSKNKGTVAIASMKCGDKTSMVISFGENKIDATRKALETLDVCSNPYKVIYTEDFDVTADGTEYHSRHIADSWPTLADW